MVIFGIAASSRSGGATNCNVLASRYTSPSGQISGIFRIGTMAQGRSGEFFRDRYARIQHLRRINGFTNWSHLWGAIDARIRDQPDGLAEPDVKALDAILEAGHDTRYRWVLNGGGQADKVIELLCDLCAARAGDFGLDPENQRRACLAYIHNGIPLEPDLAGDDSVRAHFGPALETYPFFRIRPDQVKPADADLFFNAIHQGPDAAARGWIVERRHLWSSLADSLDDSAPPAQVSVHFVGGASGSGKSTLLDLVGWEALRRNIVLYRCESAYADFRDFPERLATVITGREERMMILIDNAHLLEARNVDMMALFGLQSLGPRAAVDIVIAANWKNMRSPLALELNRGLHARSSYQLPPFSDAEIDDLLARIATAERQGEITDVRCTLPMTDRRALITNEREHNPLLALFRLRYAKGIRDALRDELAETASQEGIRLYRQIAIMESLGFPLPRPLLSELRHEETSGLLWLRQVTRIENGCLHLRHPLLVRPTLDVVSPVVEQRPDELAAVLARLAGSGTGLVETLARYFLAPSAAKRLLNFFRQDGDAISRFIDNLHDDEDLYRKIEMLDLLHCHIGALEKDVMEDYGRACDEYRAALQLAPLMGYAETQLAWSLLKAGNFRDAEATARSAISHHPENYSLLSDCSFIASWCTKDGFDLAGEIYRLILHNDAQDKITAKRLERHEEAKAVLNASHSREFSDFELEEMRAPAFIWRVRRNLRRYGQSLFGTISRAMRDQEIDPVLINEIERSETDSNNKGLRAISKAYLARSLYQRWYNYDEGMELESIESLFVDSLRIREDDAFTHCWYGTFLKEARGNLDQAQAEYERARELSAESKYEDSRDHPMITNNLALLEMARVYRQRANAKIALPKAARYLASALARIAEGNTNFGWPLDTAAQLDAMAIEFKVRLPAEYVSLRSGSKEADASAAGEKRSVCTTISSAA